METILDWILRYGYFGLFTLLMFCIAGLPVPDETLLLFSGYLISQGRLNPFLTFMASFAGSISGISLSYLAGRFIAEPVLLRYGRRLGLTLAHLNYVQSWYRRSGEWLLAIGYYIPGVRHFTALVAGMSNLAYLRFAAFAYAGAAVWAATFLSLGYLVGENWRLAIALVHRYTTLALLFFLIVTPLILWIRWRRGNRNTVD